MSKRAQIFSKMFASYAKDEDVTTEEVADAAEEIQAVAVEKPEDTAPKSAGDEGIAPAPDKLDTIIEMLSRLLGKGQDEEPEVVEGEEVVEEGGEVDPLQKLEDDLTELEAMRSEEEVDEEPEESASNFVDPEEINASEDEDPEFPVEEEEAVEEEVTDKKGCCDSLRVAIDALKPIIASLPESQRKKASDAAAKSLRKSMGMDEKPTKNGYAKLKSARKRSVDSAVSEKDLAKTIMEKRNPNFKK